MDKAYLATAAEHMRGAVSASHGERIAFAPGLTAAEIRRAEGGFGFRFPPDLRALLEFALPISPGFPNWRRGPNDALAFQLRAPTDGILFDVEHNGFWMDGWGRRPSDLAGALALARERVAAAPPLVPLYGHRFIPSEPSMAGNPVFSVVQTDIIAYGDDIADYLRHEFGVPRPAWSRRAPRPIPFWSELVGGAP